MSLLRFFGRRNPDAASADRLYAALVDQARQPWFFASGAVPDTVMGRFDLIALHGFLLLDRLEKIEGSEGLRAALGEALTDDLDRNMREMGIGDLSVGRKVKALLEGFYGRIYAYREAFAAAPADRPSDLDAVLARNLYADASPDGAVLGSIRAYLDAAMASLAAQSDAALKAGKVDFPMPGQPGETL